MTDSVLVRLDLDDLRAVPERVVVAESEAGPQEAQPAARPAWAPDLDRLVAAMEAGPSVAAGVVGHGRTVQTLNGPALAGEARS